MKLVNKNQNIEMSSKSFLSSNTKTSFNISAANSSKSSFINTFIGGIPHSKSSSNVNSISGNVAESTASVVNTASQPHAALNSNTSNKTFKIPKSASSYTIKENQLQLNDQQKQFKKLVITTAPPASAAAVAAASNSLTTNTTATNKSKMSTSLMDANIQSSSTANSSKIKIPSFNNSFTKPFTKLKSKFSLRKSHSTAANLADLAKLKISSSHTSNSLNSAPVHTTANTINNGNTSSYIISKNLISDNNGINYSQYKSEPFQIMNYRNSISFIDTDTTRRTAGDLSLDDADLYNSLTHHQYYQNQHHGSYYHSFIDNGFTAIQEEQLPNSNHLETGIGQNSLLNSNLNHSLMVQNLIQPSSSSSSLSLTNTINNANTMSHTLTNSVNSTSKTLNYGSSTSSNGTTATTTSNSLASSDMASNTSTSSPHNLIMPPNLEYQHHHQQQQQYHQQQHISSHTNSSTNKNSTPSKHSIGSILSSLSSSFSLSSASSNTNNNNNTNTNQVKLRVHKPKSKSEIQQKRISLPANINNNHMNDILDSEIELSQYYKNTTPPLIEGDEHGFVSNENNSKHKANMNESNMNNSSSDSYYNSKTYNKILNNNLNVRNNYNNNDLNFSVNANSGNGVGKNLLSKHAYTSNHHLNMYTKNNLINGINNNNNNMNNNINLKINNSISINQLNNNTVNTNSMQSYQSMSAIAVHHRNNSNMKNNLVSKHQSVLMMKPLNRNNRRASMSELGYGKIESYNKLDKLGEGTYATVFKGQSTINGSFVALKEIRLEHEEGAPCTAIREVSLLRQLKHANIVTLHDIIYTSKSLTLVFEYLEKDLKQYMDDCNNIMSLKNVKLFLFQLLRGLAYCHARQILHRDLKPQNLLINQKGELKLADFGLARAKSIPTKTYSNEVVTLWYRPPDVLLGSTDYSTHIDMWGVGCIFYEMTCGKPLFPGTKVDDELYLIFKTLGTPTEQTFPGVTTNSEYLALNLPKFQQLDLSNYSTLVPRLDSDGLSLLSSYLKYNPKERASAAESMNHRFFNTLPIGIYKLENNQSIFDEPNVTLTKDPGVKLNNAAIRSSSSSYYKF